MEQAVTRSAFGRGECGGGRPSLAGLQRWQRVTMKAVC